MRIIVRDNDVSKALRVLKRKLQNEGAFRDMRRKEHYEKPSEQRCREAREAVKRERRREARRLLREGF